MANTGELKKLLEKIIRAMFPELSNGYQFPIRAKVVKVHEGGGTVSDYDKRYSVDVQPLTKDGTADPTKPVIPDVAIPVIWAGPNRGLFCLPKVGAIVRVGFYYWDAALPYVDAVLGDGYNVPAHPVDGLILQQSNGVKVVMEPSGKVLIESSPSKITLTASGVSVESPQINMTAQSIGINGGAISVDGSGNVTMCGGGPPIARVGDAIECPHGTGRITGGSTKASCG